MNHAERNEAANNVRIESDKENVWFVALRGIGAGEELLYDYGDEYFQISTADDTEAHQTAEEAAEVKMLKAAASSGRAPQVDAHYLLARAYELGERGLRINQTQALEHFEAAAALGDTSSLLALGLAHEQGLLGLTRNSTKARLLYQAAAARPDQPFTRLGFPHLESW